MLRNEELASELEAIRLQDPNEMLRPQAVVDAVREDEHHRLRAYFTWDKDEAFDKIQLIEARQLIRVVVMDVPGSTESVRAYVSLSPDRNGQDGSNGYRSVVNVMGDQELRALMLREALITLRTFERKYRKLEALGPLFDAYQALIAEEEPANRRRKKSRRASKASRASKKVAKKKAKKKASRR